MKLDGRWFPQIVDKDSGNLYSIYILHSLVLIFDSKGGEWCGCVGGGGGWDGMLDVWIFCEIYFLVK